MRKAYLISVAVLSVVAFFSCVDKITPPEKINFGWVAEDEVIRAKYGIGTDGVFVGVNNTKVTSIIQGPIKATWAQVIYSTSDSTVVKVGPDGVITGVGKGTAWIYANIISKDKKGNDKPLSDSLKVYVDTIQVTNISLEIVAKSFSDYSKTGVLKDVNGNDSVSGDGSTVVGSIENNDTLFLNDYAVMQGTFEPLEASFTEMSWTTDNPSVFKINGDTIKAIAIGSGKIFGRMKQNHLESLTIEHKWNVKEAPLERVVWTAGSHKMYGNTNEDVNRLIVFIPSYASDKTVSFTSANPQLFGVANGRVYCYTSSKDNTNTVLTVSAPQATIGKEAKCTFKVK